MYSSKFNNNKNSKLNPYFVKEILEASPQQLLIKLYDFAIINCQKHDLYKTNSAIQELINSLSYEGEDVKEISIGFFKLYQFCQREMRAKNYDIVLEILTGLRNSWIEAFRKLGQ